LDELDSIQIPPGVLKNHPGIVQTLNKLKSFVGPSQYSEDETDEQKVPWQFMIFC